MSYKNYIFDFDGTLMDTSGVIMSTIKATIEQMGLPPRSEQQCRSIIGIRTDEAAAVLYPELPDFNAEFARIFRQNYERLRSNAHEKTFPGVLEILSRLRQQGHGLAIASSRRHSSLEDYLKGLGILEWFSQIVGAEDVEDGKPAPDPVVKVLNSKHWDTAETLVVGDADVDIMMGNAAGCPTCAVTYGNGSRQALEAAHPTYVIDSFEQLP